MGEEERVRDLVGRLDTPDFADQEAVWEELKAFGPRMADESLRAFKRFRNWQGRTTLVLRMTRYARTEESAYQLGLAACHDPSPLVRHRACGLLAYALREEAIPTLEGLLDHADKTVRNSAVAAIDAIQQKNHHYFVDRRHSGKTFWNPEKD